MSYIPCIPTYIFFRIRLEPEFPAVKIFRFENLKMINSEKFFAPTKHTLMHDGVCIQWIGLRIL